MLTPPRGLFLGQQGREEKGVGGNRNAGFLPHPHHGAVLVVQLRGPTRLDVALHGRRGVGSHAVDEGKGFPRGIRVQPDPPRSTEDRHFFRSRRKKTARLG